MNSSAETVPVRATSVASSVASIASIASTIHSQAETELAPPMKKPKKSRSQILEEAQFWKSSEAEKIFQEYSKALNGRKKNPRDGKTLSWITKVIEHSNGICFSTATVSRQWNKYKNQKRRNGTAVQVKQEILDSDEVRACETEEGHAPEPKTCTNKCFHCAEAQRQRKRQKKRSVVEQPESPQEEENENDVFNAFPLGSTTPAFPLGSTTPAFPLGSTTPSYSFLGSLYSGAPSPRSAPFGVSFMDMNTDEENAPLGYSRFDTIFSALENANTNVKLETSTDVESD